MKKKYRSITKFDGVVAGKETNFFYLGTFAFFFLLIVLGDFPAFSHERWYIGMDINQDGIFSITDLIKLVLWLFYMPGDVLIQGLLISQDTSSFFEVTGASFGKIGSTLFSLAFWFLAGGKKLVKFWCIVLLAVMLKNLPGIPFLY